MAGWYCKEPRLKIRGEKEKEKAASPSRLYGIIRRILLARREKV